MNRMTLILIAILKIEITLTERLCSSNYITLLRNQSSLLISKVTDFMFGDKLLKKRVVMHISLLISLAEDFFAISYLKAIFCSFYFISFDYTTILWTS